MNDEITNQFIMEQINKRKNHIIVEAQEKSKEISDNYENENKTISNLYNRLAEYDSIITQQNEELKSLIKEKNELDNVNIHKIKSINNDNIEHNNILIKKLSKKIKENETSINKINMEKKKINKDFQMKKDKINLEFNNISDKNRILLNNKKIFYDKKRKKILKEIEEIEKTKTELIINLKEKENIYLNEKDKRHIIRNKIVNIIIDLKNELKYFEKELLENEQKLQEILLKKNDLIKNYKKEKEIKYIEVNNKLKQLKKKYKNNLSLEISNEIELQNNIIDDFEHIYQKNIKNINYKIESLHKNIKLINYKKNLHKKEIEKNSNFQSINNEDSIGKKKINELKKEIGILEEKLIINNIDLDNLNNIQQNIIENIEDDNSLNEKKLLLNNNLLDEDFSKEVKNLNIKNLEDENHNLNSEIDYLHNLNNNLKKNSEINVNNLLKSKELNEIQQKKLNIKIQLSKDNYLRIKNKINLKKKTNTKFLKDMENSSTEIFINQLLDLYNLKKLNEIVL